MAGIKPTTISKNEGKASSWKLFVNTYLVTALNPKGIIFFVAFLPQFINANAEATPQLWALAITFVALATLNATMYAVFAGKAQQVLSSPKTQRIFNIWAVHYFRLLGSGRCQLSSNSKTYKPFKQDF